MLKILAHFANPFTSIALRPLSNKGNGKRFFYVKIKFSPRGKLGARSYEIKQDPANYDVRITNELLSGHPSLRFGTSVPLYTKRWR